MTGRFAQGLLALALAASSGADTGGAGPSARWMAELAGRWSCAGAFDRTGAPLNADIDFDWEAAARALVVRHRDVAPGAYASVELWFVRADGGVTATVADSADLRRFESDGVRDGALALTRTGAAGAAVERFTYALAPSDGLTVRWEIDRNGRGLAPGDHLACGRANVAPAAGEAR